MSPNIKLINRLNLMKQLISTAHNKHQSTNIHVQAMKINRLSTLYYARSLLETTESALRADNNANINQEKEILKAISLSLSTYSLCS